MRNHTADPLLQTAAVLGRTIEWLPVWVLMLASFCGRSVAAGSGVLALFAFSGIWISRRLYGLRSRRIGTVLRFLLLIVTVCGAVFVLHLLTERYAVPAILALATQSTVIFGADAKPEKLFSFTAYVFSMTGMVVTFFMLRIASLPTYNELLVGGAILSSALYFFLRNQLMLQRMVNRRSSSETAVPKEIRRGNLLMFCGVLTILLLLFLFRAPLLWLLQQIWSLLVLLIRTLFRGLSALVSYLSGDPPADVPMEPMPADGGSNHAQAQQEGNPLWSLLLIPLFAIVVYFWHVFLSDWLYVIREALGKWLRRLRGTDGSPRAIVHSEFTDTETRAQREPPARVRKRRWRKAYRAWQKLPEGDAKFYAGYRLLLTAPAWEHPAPAASDTVLEIREKWAADYEPETLLHAVTEDFHADRYAETGLPAGAAEDLAKALAAMQ